MAQNDPVFGNPDDFPPPGFVPGGSTIPGIEVYVPAAPGRDQPEIIDFTCPRCGATTAFNVNDGKLSCTHCGYSKTPVEERLGQAAEGFEFRVETVALAQRTAGRGWGENRKELACQHCGGVVSVPPDAISFACPFCGSNKVLFREPLEEVLRPRYLIPFKTSPQQCEGISRTWLGSSWMLPRDLRSTAVEKFSPIFIPYWTFSASCRATWKAQVAHETTERHYINGEMKEYHKIEWRDEAGKVQKQYNDLLVPGTTRWAMKTLARIDSYDIADLIRYEPSCLAGIQAQNYDLPLDEAWRAGRQLMRERTRQACLDRVSSSNMRNFTMTLDFDEEQWRYILTPLYASLYHYEDKTYQILINGQNGKIAGPKPVDWEKIWLVLAVILSPGLLLALTGWLFSANQAGTIMFSLGLFLVVVALVISFFIIRQAREMENV